MTTIAPKHRHAQNVLIPARRAAGSTPPGRRRNFVVASIAGFALALTATGGNASAHPDARSAHHATAVVNTGRIYFGVDGTQSQAAASLNVARHLYGQLSSSVPDARMVTMGINGLSYASVAAAGPGSPIYDSVVRWADTIGARGSLTFFGFVKEPEASDDAHFGTANEYIAAYQHVVDIFRSQDLTNVRYVWQMTAHSFMSTTATAAINYYPGDSYVDVVAEDPYNWGGCGPGGPWRDLNTAANPALSFAEAHGKLAMLGEFASQTGPQRASWLASAQQWLVANRGEIQAAFYFDRPPTTSLGHACVWSLTSTADIAAFRAIVDDTTYFTY